MKHHRLNRRSAIAITLSFLVTTVGVITGVYLQNQNQDIRQRAAGTSAQAQIALSPSAAYLAPGQPQQLAVTLNTANDQIIGLQLQLHLEGTIPDNLGFVPEQITGLTLAHQELHKETNRATLTLAFIASFDPTFTPPGKSFTGAPNPYSTIDKPFTLGYFNFTSPDSGQLTLRFDSTNSVSLQPGSTENIIAFPDPQTYNFATEPTPTPESSRCIAPPTDIILAIDKSGSMKNQESGQTKLAWAKQAAVEFITSITEKPSTNIRMGVITYDTTVSQTIALTSDLPGLLTKVQNLPTGAGGNTCTVCALTQAGQALFGSSSKKIIIILADGQATYTLDKKKNIALAEEQAFAAADTLRADGVVIFAAHFGDPNKWGENMIKYAGSTENYSFKPSVQQWSTAFGNLGDAVCQDDTDTLDEAVDEQQETGLEQTIELEPTPTPTSTPHPDNQNVSIILEEEGPSPKIHILDNFSSTQSFTVKPPVSGCIFIQSNSLNEVCAGDAAKTVSAARTYQTIFSLDDLLLGKYKESVSIGNVSGQTWEFNWADDDPDTRINQVVCESSGEIIKFNGAQDLTGRIVVRFADNCGNATFTLIDSGMSYAWKLEDEPPPFTPKSTPTPTPTNAAASTLPPKKYLKTLTIITDFAGVPRQRHPIIPARVQIGVADSATSLFNQILEFTPGQDNHFSAKLDLSATNFEAGQIYWVTVKGEKHLQRFFGNLTLGEDYTLEATGKPLIPGDIPPQDGVANNNDINLIFSAIGQANQKIKEFNLADLNYDGVINSLDSSLFIQALQIKYDELYSNN